MIGVNSQIATAGSGQGNVGIGFAIPSNTVRDVVPQLETGETVAHAFLGVSTSGSPTGSGALVRQVTPNGPAAKAGLQASTSPTGEGGDVIVAVDGKPVTSPDDVISAVSAKRPGDQITVVALRDGRRVTIDVTPRNPPEERPRSPHHGHDVRHPAHAAGPARDRRVRGAVRRRPSAAAAPVRRRSRAPRSCPP